MSKKYYFHLFFIIISFLFINIKILRAAGLVLSSTEGICHINNCFVPAPTIVQPVNNQTIKTTRPVIRGLTWKRTLVDIYLDGQYQGAVFLKEEENHLQSFFWQPATDLPPGKHYLFTLAYNARGYDKNLKGWDQSKESSYIYFTVIKKDFIQTDNFNFFPGTEKSSNDKINNSSSPAGQSQDETKNNQPLKTEVKKTIQRKINKFDFKIIIPLVFVIITLAILLINYALIRKKKYLKLLIEKKDDDHRLPGPPPNQSTLGI